MQMETQSESPGADEEYQDKMEGADGEEGEPEEGLDANTNPMGVALDYVTRREVSRCEFPCHILPAFASIHQLILLHPFNDTNILFQHPPPLYHIHIRFL